MTSTPAETTAPASSASTAGAFWPATLRIGLLRGGLEIRSIRAAARGESVLAPAVAGRLLTRMRGAPQPETLSPREVAVLALIARGLTNAQVGRRLHISEATVKTHLARTCVKLGVTGRTAAVMRALETGSLPPPGAAS